MSPAIANSRYRKTYFNRTVCGQFGLAALLLLLVGCAEVTVHRADNSELTDDWRNSLMGPGGLSPRTVQILRQLDLDRAYYDRPVEVFGRLRALTTGDPKPEQLFALAEISYDLARKAEEREKQDAVFFYYLSAGFAYQYLTATTPQVGPDKSQTVGQTFLSATFRQAGKPAPQANETVSNTDSVPGPGEGRAGVSPSAFDPHFRLACDLYNTSLTKCLRSAMKSGRLDPNQPAVFRTDRGSSLTLTIELHGFPWRSEEFGELRFCADYQVSGLENQYHTYGLGVPLMCERSSVAPRMTHAAFPRELYFPVTAFLRFEDNPPNQSAHARLELLNPLVYETTQVNGTTVPLEGDLTTPLAYGLSRSEAYLLQYEGFLSADKLQNKTGIYMLEPYQPGKIPVLFVHGLLSSPPTWAKMFNDLRADPFIRQRFQFWGYFYPTGDSYFLTAADLRQRLADLRTELDPEHKDPALDDMVCVGHSMGGLVSKLLTVDSGDSYWRLVSARPFESLKMEPGTRQELQQVFFFQPQPSVRRVIFIGTPHQGSSLSRIGVARLAEKIIRMPKALLQAGRDVARENPNAPNLMAGKLCTSVNLLEPNSPALELLAAQSRPDGVHYHSIIGILPPDELWINTITPVSHHGKEKSDGVVPYSSAHLDNVDSELIIPADHMHVHQHALSTLEVRRILLEHLKQ
jgi:pimeloyl-ACP methyl ester carboxylesterase